ncbi:uncharacterized protein LOC115221815 [Argonauta hians]
MEYVVSYHDYLYQSWPRVKNFFVNVVHKKQNILSQKDLEENPSLCEKVVGLYLISGRPSDSQLQNCLKKLVNLRVICFLGIGFDSIDTTWAKSRGIRIGHSQQDGSTAANFGMALLLTMARKIIQCSSYFSKNPGGEVFPSELAADDVTGKTIGIIGMGSIGYKLALRAHAFDMQVLYHQRRQRSKEEESKVGGVFYSELLEMLPLCDYVMITCALTPQTQHMISHTQLEAMKNTAVIINIARGQIINQEALVGALESGKIAGAALDVTTPEPLPLNHKLSTLPNVILTPHCATNTVDMIQEVCETAFNNMEQGLHGEAMVSEVILN